MDAYKKVVWKEGMFIAPQHFQQQDRFLQNYIQQNIETLAGFSPFFGITKLAINSPLLKVGKLAVSECAGIFPDGSQFSFNQEILLDIPDTAIEKLVYLALPISLQGKNEYAATQADASRYLGQTINVFDNATSENASVEIDVARANISLKSEDEDLSGFTCIPLAKVLECDESGAIILDRSFIPSCLHYSASSFLSERLKELCALVNNRATLILQRIQAGQQQKSEQTLMLDYLWLQTLNSRMPWLEWVINNSQYSTHQLYQELSRFEGELLSLQPAIPNGTEKLKVEDLYPAFNRLFSSLRDMLTLIQQDSVIEFQWDKQLFEKRRLLRTLIKDPQILDNRRFVLAVKSPQGSVRLNELFPIAAKLSGNARIAELVRNALSGIELNPLPIAPIELKAQQGVAYFEVNTLNELWQEMLQGRDTLALHLDSRIQDPQITLYALK